MGIESRSLVTANVFLMQGLRMVFADVDLESHSNELIAMAADKTYT
jgi:dTDP-4-amino-4,6-dideoxygalactose transaminase